MALQTAEKGKCEALTLFGGEEGWCSADWTSRDDSVRGGKSQSYLDCSKDTARFYGTLDIKTLGGAGFASQRTRSDDLDLDLCDYAGINLEIRKGDMSLRLKVNSEKRYTFIMKDDLQQPSPDTGREQATIAWECDFELAPQDKPEDAQDTSVFIPWDALNPTFRGKVKKDADPIKLDQVKRISIMNRSFFGSQEGDFSLEIKSISALCEVPTATNAIRIVASRKSDGLRSSVQFFQGVHMSRKSICALLGSIAAVLLVYITKSSV